MRTTLWHLPKRLELLNSSRVFDRLPFSLSLRCNENFRIGREDSRSRGCEPVRWMSNDTHIYKNYASRSPEPPGLGELVSPCSMSIAGLSETISGDTGFVSFLVNFCHKVFNSCCITGEIHTSFSIGESVISILPSSLVMYRLLLRLLASEDSLGFRCWIL
jgi:hypothetical protein